MSLLEVITKASAEATSFASESEYPITLNPDPILLNLKPGGEDVDIAFPLVNRVEGFQISSTDAQIIELGKKFLKNLKRKLKNTNTFGKAEFIEMFSSYLEEIGGKIGISLEFDKSSDGYTRKLVEKVGFSLGRDVLGLVLEACIDLEIWDLLECLLVNKLVGYSCSSCLILNFIEKRRSDLICSCVKHLSDLQASDMLHILKYFLLPPGGAYCGMLSVRKEWETDALLATEKLRDKSIGKKKLIMAKEAAVLLMIAHDGFTASELCLHYLFASSSLDEVIFSTCISKLTGSEITNLIRYLGKWLKKYERFPQAAPCPEAPSLLGLKLCRWVPTLEAVVKCYGLVLDEHFSSLVLDPGFQEELASIGDVVSSLVAEARHSCTLANVVDQLRIELKG